MAGERSLASGVKISFGLPSTSGNLYTIASDGDKDTATKLACPTCTDAEGMKQKYHGETCGHGPFEKGECDTAMIRDNKLVKVSKEDVDAARKSELPPKRIDVRAFPRTEVEQYTQPQGSAYVFIPDTQDDFYKLLLHTLRERDDLVLMAMANVMRGADKLWMLTLGINGNLVLHECAWPEDVKERAQPDASEVNPAHAVQMDMMLENMLEEFDPDEFKRAAREALREVLDATTGGTTVTRKKSGGKAAASDDLLALLAESNERLQKAKKPTKTPKKAKAS